MSNPNHLKLHQGRNGLWMDLYEDGTVTLMERESNGTWTARLADTEANMRPLRGYPTLQAARLAARDTWAWA